MQTNKSIKGYDRLARIYVWLEYLGFGSALMRCRLALIDELKDAKRMLIIGEGDGRFLAAVLAKYPDLSVVVIEQSPKMIALAKARVSSDRVEFIAAGVFEAELHGSFDVIVTCFFIDLLNDLETVELLRSLSSYLLEDGFWYYADFSLPNAFLKRLYALAMFRLMVWFFAWQTGFEGRYLVDAHSLFNELGFKLMKTKVTHFDFLTTSLYKTL